MIFELVRDFAAVLEAMPKEHPRRRILKLLDEAVRRDVHFIDRHPTTVFQCLWNTCWWYDCAEAAQHYDEPYVPTSEKPGHRLSHLLESWRAAREDSLPGFSWLRALRAPWVHLGTAQLAVLRGHEDQVESVSYSPDARRIVSSSRDSTVRVWDAESGAELAVLRGHERAVNTVSYSPDARRIVSSSSDKTVRVWDAETGDCLEVIPRTHDAIAIASSRERAWRALRRGGETVVDDVASARPVTWYSEALSHIATHPSGHAWAGRAGNHLHIIQLEGSNDPAPRPLESDQPR